MRAAFALLALAACATPAASGALPDRAAVGEAIGRGLACEASEGVVCGEQPRRTIVHALRCRPAATPASPGRVFCRFSVRQLFRSRVREFGPVCVWLVRDPGEPWRIDIWPDADVCDS